MNTIRQFNKHLWSLCYTVVDVGGDAKFERGHSCLGTPKHKEKGVNLPDRKTDKVHSGASGTWGLMREQEKLSRRGDWSCAQSGIWRLSRELTKAWRVVLLSHCASWNHRRGVCSAARTSGLATRLELATCHSPSEFSLMLFKNKANPC